MVSHYLHPLYGTGCGTIIYLWWIFENENNQWCYNCSMLYIPSEISLHIRWKLGHYFRLIPFWKYLPLMRSYLAPSGLLSSRKVLAANFDWIYWGNFSLVTLILSLINKVTDWFTQVILIWVVVFPIFSMVWSPESIMVILYKQSIRNIFDPYFLYIMVRKQVNTLFS